MEYFECVIKEGKHRWTGQIDRELERATEIEIFTYYTYVNVRVFEIQTANNLNTNASCGC